MASSSAALASDVAQLPLSLPRCSPASPPATSSDDESPSSAAAAAAAGTGSAVASASPFRSADSAAEASRSSMPVKYLIVTGGTISGLGKGTAISSIGVVLKAMGLQVTAMKIDPYLNVDAGTMSPLEHGEVYVLDDGGEADLDLGNYERFLDLSLTSKHSLTTGKIYEHVIKNERKGNYLGKTVQMVPHVTDAIQEWILSVGSTPVADGSGACAADRKPEICLVELGGTVGELESAVYAEALQQLQYKVGRENFLMVHVGFVPTVAGEQKTKPCQNGVRTLREAGLKPDLLLCRSELPLQEAARKKLSLFCQVAPEAVISMHDLSNTFKVPLLLNEQRVGQLVCKHFDIAPSSLSRAPALPLREDFGGALSGAARSALLGDWKLIADRLDQCTERITIAVVGKYTALEDAYTSVVKALKHAAVEAGVDVKIVWVESSDLEPATKEADAKKFSSAWQAMKCADGVLVPGGFGDRGIEGKILAANFCRTKDKPFFGICVGMQTAVIEFARNVLDLEGANSTEFNASTAHPVVIFMPESSLSVLGGTMRLGSRATVIRDPASLGARLHAGQQLVHERHRHRYEVNAALVPALEAKGLIFSGQDENQERMEMVEIPEHPFFFACQYHPEYTSRPARPSPPFLGLVLAAAGRLEERIAQDGGVLRSGAGFSRAVVNVNEPAGDACRKTLEPTLADAGDTAAIVAGA
eukprot:TRINITY_DN71341_c0_g1_i1.p1 TRINITY_DN71341_c0_g1~~TRINITY_DN71341_c0_g1_i1.p1  ORF type:complete len:736 (+),score=194.30 TRINITY_DN71341_c0_g1_i1:105-2210(+)